MNKVFKKEEITPRDYNFIISNVILSETGKFTYSSMLSKISKMLGVTDMELESTFKQTLVRLREDGFLNVLGSTYTVNGNIRI